MDDKYFEEILNEENEPFSDFVSRLSPSLFSPLHRVEALSESSNFLDIESPKAELISFSLKSEQSNEELKECLLADKQGDNLVMKPSDKPASKKKCAAKTEQKEEVPSEDMPSKKAERNKRYAKESRERKKKYVEGLEQQVVLLRQEVEFYQAKLRNYETIEKFKNTLGYEFYEALNKAYAYMREANQPLTNEQLFKDNLCKAFGQVLEEQTKALRTIGKMIMDVSLPAHVRILFWMTEKSVNKMEVSEVVKTLSPILTLEQANHLNEFREMIYPEEVKYNEFDDMIKTASKKIKEALRQIIVCLKDNPIQRFNFRTAIRTSWRRERGWTRSSSQSQK
eukprot:TRINITY_DN7694_c0_g1_i4.p1 TRINITY_DN7694_c0_g1~~TRINITY_DN7694_c0_g1_i4.p1  ORF type:complete len:338 (+),score=56.75 TRINITY_DN7694_c0_g1_i4:140-1153(+)